MGTLHPAFVRWAFRISISIFIEDLPVEGLVEAKYKLFPSGEKHGSKSLEKPENDAIEGLVQLPETYFETIIKVSLVI